VRRSFLLLSSCLLMACVGGNAQGNNIPADQDAATAARNELDRLSSSEQTSGSGELIPARFYVDPANRAPLAVVREHTEPRVTINGHYSLSMVSCGIACMSYWIVDRNTGAVIDVPARSDSTETEEIEIVRDIHGRLDSDVIRITYGSMDSLTDNCRYQDFRLSGHTLLPTGRSSPIACPGSRHRQ
jgi:hypothetical protein